VSVVLFFNVLMTFKLIIIIIHLYSKNKLSKYYHPPGSLKIIFFFYFKCFVRKEQIRVFSHFLAILRTLRNTLIDHSFKFDKTWAYCFDCNYTCEDRRLFFK